MPQSKVPGEMHAIHNLPVRKNRRVAAKSESDSEIESESRSDPDEYEQMPLNRFAGFFGKVF